MSKNTKREKTAAMRSAVKFLCHVYQDDFSAVATIVTAEADGDVDVIESYLNSVESYCVKLKAEIKGEE